MITLTAIAIQAIGDERQEQVTHLRKLLTEAQ